MTYEKETKFFYKSDQKAKEYHDWYTRNGGLNGLRFKYIANKERAAVTTLLRTIPHGRVIDIPAGTGKMAPVFKQELSRVLACDVSENMLRIGEQVYRAEGVDAEFRVVALEAASEEISGDFDVTVCVRLMHRVPDDVKLMMLAQIAKLSPYAIVSFAIDSPYERVRRRLRRLLLSRGGDGVPVYRTWPKRVELERMLNERFVIERSVPVARMISSEVMYLLRSKADRIIQL